MKSDARYKRVATLVQLFQRSHQITLENPFLTPAQMDSITEALNDSIHRILDQEFKEGFDAGYQITFAEFEKVLKNLRLS